MIPYYHILQGAEEWHAIRHGKISGTSAKGLFTKTDTLLIELVSELAEEFEPEYDVFISKEMNRGHDLEPAAREALEKYTGIKFNQCGWMQSTENELVGISPDGISDDETVVCEIKCPGAAKHVRTCLEGGIPSDHIHQCVMYFVVQPKLERLVFASYRPECVKPLCVYELTIEHLINLGTSAKPRMVSVRDAVSEACSEINRVTQLAKAALEQLAF